MKIYRGATEELRLLNEDCSCHPRPSPYPAKERQHRSEIPVPHGKETDAVRGRQLICTSLVRSKQSLQTKPSASRQTRLAGARIQPRDKKGNMDSGLAEPGCVCRSPGCRVQPTPRFYSPKGPRRPRTGKFGCKRGTRHHLQATAWAGRPFPQRCGPCPPGRRPVASASPPPLPQQPAASSFVYEPLDPKSPSTECIKPGWLSQAMSSTLLALQGFNQ